jgi:hypothetical protein
MTFTDAPEFDDKADNKGDGTHPRFFMEVVQNRARSEADGVPRFDEVEMVEILVPGDRLNSPVQRVSDAHRKRWPRQYAAFKAGQGDSVQGTPIDQLPGMTRAQAEELRYFKILSIEQLAEMPEGLLMKARPMDGRALQDKAKRWIDTAAGAATEERLAAENRAKDEKISSMEAQLADMKRLMDGMQAQLNAQGSAAAAPPPVTQEA